MDVQLPRLSPRQLSCLSRVAEGEYSIEIANGLGLSPKTIDEHIAEACHRLGVRSRT